MPKAFPVELREVVKSMILAGVRPHIVAEENRISPALVHRWSKRYGWAKAVNTARQKIKDKGLRSLANQAAADIGAASANTRASLASVVERQAAVLAREEPKAADLANTRERQGQAAVAKSIMETARGVFGWGEESRPGMVLSVHLSAEPASKPTICSALDVAGEVSEVSAVDIQPVTPQLNDPDIVRTIEQGAAAQPPAEQAPAASPGPNPQ